MEADAFFEDYCIGYFEEVYWVLDPIEEEEVRDEIVNFFNEKFSNGKEFKTAYFSSFTLQNTDLFVVPEDHYFFLGDNRDCSKDSRFLSSVGYVHKNNLVGKARFIFFSSDARNGSIFEFWKWGELIRFDRFFKVIN